VRDERRKIESKFLLFYLLLIRSENGISYALPGRVEGQKTVSEPEQLLMVSETLYSYRRLVVMLFQ